MNRTKDKNGNAVEVGSRVRVLNIGQSVIARLSPEEAQQVASMKDEVFEVYEIDDWGAAWVKRWWHADRQSGFSHSLALASEEMELIPE